MGQSQSQALPILQCHPCYCFLRDIWCITYKKGDFLPFLGSNYNRAYSSHGSLGTRQPCLQESTGRHNLRSLPRQLHTSAGPDGAEESHSRVPRVPSLTVASLSLHRVPLCWSLVCRALER